MAARRVPSVCLACQARQALIGRRRPGSIKRRRMETMAVCAVDNSAVMVKETPSTRRQRADETDRRQTAVVVGETLPTWKLGGSVGPAVAEALQDLEILWKEKKKRLEILGTLSNPWPKQRHTRYHNEAKAAPKSELPHGNAGLPIPHDVFRRNLANATSEKTARQILRAQLLRCETPHSILRVVAYSLMLNRHTRMHIAALHEPIMRALYRCRTEYSDVEVLSTLTAIHGRFKIYGVRLDPQLVVLGLKFAARTRSLRYMRKYLKAMRENGLMMTSNVFRATIAKFSIGHRGLGEIRNGRWRRDELLEVCTGFRDCAHLTPHQQYHLGTFLDRDDWQFLHGWIAVLARCKNSEAVWQEWELWKQAAGRLRPKNLASQSPLMTTKTRGDYWFLEQMAYSGGLKEAWQILEETETSFSFLKDRISSKLLDGIEHCPPAVWRSQGAAITNALLEKCDLDLGKIERAMSLAWMPTDLDDDGIGYHHHVEDQEDMFDRLGADDFRFDDEPGYPYDADAIVPEKDLCLHDAAEVSSAG